MATGINHGNNILWDQKRMKHLDGEGSSPEIYDQMLMQCFGPRPHGMPTDLAKARRPYEAYFLPDAYKGRSDYLLTSIIDAVISGNSFVTGRCLPLLQHDNPEITWSTMSFDNAFVDYEPEQGVPRLLTQRSATFQDHMARRGIAFVVNHGFANTEGGRLDFFYKLAHMKHVLQETLDQDGLIQLINCKNDYGQISNGYRSAFERSDGDLARATERSRGMFAMIQKDPDGRERRWAELDEEIKNSMKLKGVVPDTWIVPPGMKSFAAFESSSVEYYRAGPIAEKNIENGGSQNDVFRGSSVFTCNSYHLDNADADVNPFVRDRVIGDFFILRDWAANRVVEPGGAAAEQWKDRRLKTQVYCCGTDKWETFDLESMGDHLVKNIGGDDNMVKDLLDALVDGGDEYIIHITCNKWALSANGKDLVKGGGANGEVDFETGETWALDRLNDTAGTGGESDGDEAMAKTNIGNMDADGRRNLLAHVLHKERFKAKQYNVSKDGKSASAANEQRVDFSLVCVRPFRRYAMGSAVLMASGLDTGFTAHAHEDVQVGDDPISHVHVTHFTGWFSSTIVDPKRVCVAHDVYCMEYRGGEDKTIIKASEFRSKHPYQYMFEQHGSMPGSIIPLLARADCGDRSGSTPEALDLSNGKQVPCGNCAAYKFDHFKAFNNRVWDLASYAHGAASGQDAVDNECKFSGDPTVNLLCFQTMQKVIHYSDGNCDFGAYVPNCDHFGADHIGPGSREARNGGFRSLKKMDFSRLVPI